MVVLGSLLRSFFYGSNQNQASRSRTISAHRESSGGWIFRLCVFICSAARHCYLLTVSECVCRCLG